MFNLQLTNYVCVWSGVCHNVSVSEIISVREQEEENSSRRRDDGSWKKIKESEGKDCRQAFTGKHTPKHSEKHLKHICTHSWKHTLNSWKNKHNRKHSCKRSKYIQKHSKKKRNTSIHIPPKYLETWLERHLEAQKTPQIQVVKIPRELSRDTV